MNREELEARIENLSKEVRMCADEFLDTSKDVKEVEERSAKLKAELAQAKKELAQLDAPVDGGEVRSAIFNRDEWLKVAKGETRSLTIGSTGAINQVKQLFKEIADNDDLLNKASFYYGPNASTNIPVLATIDDPASFAEGATNASADTSAGVSVTEIQPLGYVSVLPITAEALTMNTINLEAELPSIFGKAFKKIMHQGMLTGIGSSKAMKGLFVSAASNADGKISMDTGKKYQLSKLAELALKCTSKDEEFTIVMNPGVYGKFLADSTSGEDIKLYKESLIRDKSIEGVKVFLDPKAPNLDTDGAAVAVGAPLARYAIGQATQVSIDTIKVKGDTNTYFQATMFFSGKQISDKDIYWLELNT